MEETTMVDWRKVRRRGRDDRGAALIEAAFVLPVALILVFGIIELGLIFRTASVDASASRTGARLASATYATAANQTTQAGVIADAVARDLSDLDGWALPVEMWLYKSSAGGLPAGGTCGTNCIKWTWDSGTKKFVSPVGTWATPDACGRVIDRVGVYIKINHSSLTGTTPSRAVIQKAVMRLEPKPNGTGSGQCVGE